MYETEYSTIYNSKYELYDCINKVRKDIDVVMDKLNNNKDLKPSEVNKIMFDTANIGCGGRRFENKPYDFLKDENYAELSNSFYEMIKKYRENLKDLVTSDEDPLYKYFDEAPMRMATLNSLGNSNICSIYSDACDIDMSIKRKLKELKNKESEEIIYDDKNKLFEVFLKIEKISDGKGDPYSSNQLELLKPIMEDIQMALDRTPKEYEALKAKRHEEQKKKKDQDDPVI